MKSIAAEAAKRISEKERRLHSQSSQPLNRKMIVVVEGVGDWVEQTYRPLFKKLVDSGESITLIYADDTTWKERPSWVGAGKLEPWEIYLDKADPLDFARYRNLRPDAVFIVTPDFTHSEIARGWLGYAAVVFVEKPFDSRLNNINNLIAALGRRSPRTAVLGLDHYQFYALPLYEMMREVEGHLGGALARVDFYMAEQRPIEYGRERTLQHGLTLDLLPHFLALLTYLGDVNTIDEIQVIAAGQYDPLESVSRDGSLRRNIAGQFRNETYSLVKFTFQDYTGSGYRVPCLSVVGKGLSQEAKYLELTGINGRKIRVDFNRQPDPNPEPDYPWDSVFFLDGGSSVDKGAQLREVADPYNSRRALQILHDQNNPKHFCRRLERNRYEKLLEDLLKGTSNAVAGTLLLTEAEDIVQGLDRIWQAIQAARPAWKNHELRRLDPISLVENV